MVSDFAPRYIARGAKTIAWVVIIRNRGTNMVAKPLK